MIIYVESSVETEEILASAREIPPQQPNEVSQQQTQELARLKEENSRLVEELERVKKEREEIETTLSSDKVELTKEIDELKSMIKKITEQRDETEKEYKQLLSNDHSSELSNKLSETQKELDEVYFLHSNNN